MQNTESNQQVQHVKCWILNGRSRINIQQNQQTNHMLHRTKTMQAMLKSRAQRDSRTYLIRGENRHGQMSKQKTAFVFAGLSDRKGQTEREETPQEQMWEQRENTERFVRQRSSKQLDPTAVRQGWTSCPLYGSLLPGRWHILGVVVKCHTWSR